MCEDTKNTDFAELMKKNADELSVDGRELVRVILESEHQEQHRPGGQSQLPAQYVTKALDLVKDKEPGQ